MPATAEPLSVHPTSPQTPRRVVTLMAVAVLLAGCGSPSPESQLAEADEAFITSSTKEVLPVVQIDDVVIGNGRPGPNSRALLAEFRAYARSLKPVAA